MAWGEDDNRDNERGRRDSAPNSSCTASLGRRGWLLALLLCSLSFGPVSPRALADSRLDFTLRNRLGVTIKSIYISPHQAGNWEEDLLGNRVLDDGADIRIHFSPGDEGRGDIWDLKVITSENNVYIWQSPGFNLNRVSDVTVFMKGGQANASSR
jgi:hypothetical protein